MDALGGFVFGSDDGVLCSLNAATGAFVGSVALNGFPTAAALANGRVYLGTDQGTVLALNEVTGAPVWSQTLAAAVHSPPAVDTVKATLVVGDDAGTVTALDATTAASVWTATTNAAVTSPAAISGGSMYVGSIDGNLYAYNEMSGKPNFTSSTGHPTAARMRRMRPRRSPRYGKAVPSAVLWLMQRLTPNASTMPLCERKSRGKSRATAGGSTATRKCSSSPERRPRHRTTATAPITAPSFSITASPEP